MIPLFLFPQRFIFMPCGASARREGAATVVASGYKVDGWWAQNNHAKKLLVQQEEENNLSNLSKTFCSSSSLLGWGLYSVRILCEDFHQLFQEKLSQIYCSKI